MEDIPYHHTLLKTILHRLAMKPSICQCEPSSPSISMKAREDLGSRSLESRQDLREFLVFAPWTTKIS